MVIFQNKKQFWSIIIFFLTAILLVLALNKNFQADIIGMRNIHKPTFNVLVYLLSLIPAILLFASDYWKKQLIHKRILLFGLLLFLIGINFQVSQAFQSLLIFALAAIYYYSKEKRIYRPNIFLILMIIYFFTEVLSLTWSFNVTKGVEYLGRLSPLVLVPLLFSLFRLNVNDYHLITKYFFRFSLFYVAISIGAWILECHYVGFPLEKCFTLQKYVIGIHAPYELTYAWSNHYHPTYNALNVLVSISFGWYYVFKKDIKSNISFIELSFLVIASLLLTIITASRFMFVGWVVANIGGVLYVIRTNKKILYILIALLIGMVCSHNFTTRTSNFVKDPIRVCLYNAAFESIKENPVLGTGLGGMIQYINKNNSAFKPLKIKSTDEFPHIHPHNQFVGDLMQTGILGLTMIVSIIFSLLYLGCRKHNWLVLVNTAVFIFLMNIEMPLMYPPGIFIFTLVFAFLTNTQENSKNNLI